MPSLIKPLFLAALLSVSGAGISAQETENTAASDLSLGVPVDGELQPGQPYVREEFGDWSIRCLFNPDGGDPCQMYQLLSDADGNDVAEFNMFPLPEGGNAAAGANIIAPLGTLLTQGVTMSVDGGAARRYPFTVCNANGCVARVGFTADEVAQFKSGNAATLIVVPFGNPDAPVSLNVSLTGFTAAFDSGNIGPN